MPTYCAPCPVKRNATLGGAPAGRPRRAAPFSSPRARAAKASGSLGRTASDHNAATRKCARPTFAVRAAPSSVAPGRDIASAYRIASCSNALSVRAEIEMISMGRGRPHAASVRAGACSRTRCALVPLKPKELTPPMRGPRRPVSGQGVSLVAHVRRSGPRECAGWASRN